MNILITGTGTLLGNTIARILAKKKYNIFATYNKSYPKNLKRNNIKLIKLNLEKKIKKKFNKINIIIHCASAVPSNQYSFAKFNNINFNGFKRLIKQSISNCTKKIILISTMSVYGKINVDKLTENYKGKKLDFYGKSKRKMENFLLKFSKKNKIIPIILRLPGIIGKNSKNNFISNIIRDVKKNKKVYFSNPNFKFNNIIHVNNVGEIIKKALIIENKKIIYNLASRNPIKLSTVINNIYFNLKKKKNCEIKKAKIKPFQILINRELLKKYNLYSVSKSLKLACV